MRDWVIRSRTVYIEETLVPEGTFVDVRGRPIRMVREVPLGQVIQATIHFGFSDDSAVKSAVKPPYSAGFVRDSGKR